MLIPMSASASNDYDYDDDDGGDDANDYITQQKV